MEWLDWFNSAAYFRILAKIMLLALPIIYLSEYYRRYISKKAPVVLSAETQRKFTVTMTFFGALIAFALLITVGIIMYKGI